MEVSAKSPDWDSEDSLHFREWLKTKTGLRLIPKLVESVPTLLSGGPTNEILIRNGEHRGFTLAVQSLLLLTETQKPTVPEQPFTESFPPLDDDEKWNDGQQLKQ